MWHINDNLHQSIRPSVTTHINIWWDYKHEQAYDIYITTESLSSVNIMLQHYQSV